MSWLMRMLIASPTLPSTEKSDSWSMLRAGNFDDPPARVRTSLAVQLLLPPIEAV